MIEVAELRELLGLGDDTSKDDQIAALEAWAVAHAEHETGEFFGVTDAEAVYVFGWGLPYLWLPYPLTTPVVLERVYPGGTTTAVTDFVVRAGALLRTGGNVWTYGYEYEVAGNRGYAVGLEPELIRQYVRDLVAWRYHYGGKEGLQSESIGGYSWSRADSETGDAAPAPPWRRHRVG